MASEWGLAEEFMSVHPEEAARILARFPPDEAAAVLEGGRTEPVVGVLQSMERISASECLSHWESGSLRRVLPAMPRQAVLRLLRFMEEEARDRVLDLAPEETARSLRLLLSYPEGTAGALMDPRFVVLPQELRVGEVRRRFRRYAGYGGYYLYVEDRDHRLVGALSLRELMRASPDELLSSWTRRPVARLPARARQDAITIHPGWRLYHCLPVVDEVDDKEVPVGVIRYRTLRSLEGATSAPHYPGILSLALTLGEMYWIGSTRLLGGLGHALRFAPSWTQERVGS